MYVYIFTSNAVKHSVVPSTNDGMSNDSDVCDVTYMYFVTPALSHGPLPSKSEGIYVPNLVQRWILFRRRRRINQLPADHVCTL